MWPRGAFQKQQKRFLTRRVEVNEVKAAVPSRSSSECSAATPALPICFCRAEIHREVFKIVKANDFEVRTELPGLRKSQTCFKGNNCILFIHTGISPWTQISWYWWPQVSSLQGSSFLNAAVLLCATSPPNPTRHSTPNQTHFSENKPVCVPCSCPTGAGRSASRAMAAKQGQKVTDLGFGPEKIFMKRMQLYFKGAFLREPAYSDCFWFSKTRSWHFLQEVQHFLISSNSHLWEMLQFIPAFEGAECH